MIVGVGLDLVDVDRFRVALGRTPHLVERLFTAAERDIHGHGDAAHRLAARFAAKEALLKAFGLGLGAVPFHDVVVESLPSGQPASRCTAKRPHWPPSEGRDCPPHAEPHREDGRRRRRRRLLIKLNRGGGSRGRR